MRSFISSEGPRLVRIKVPCAQTMVAIEIHRRINGTKGHTFQEAYSCSVGHRALSEVSDGLYFVTAWW